MNEDDERDLRLDLSIEVVLDEGQLPGDLDRVDVAERQDLRIGRQDRLRHPHLQRLPLQRHLLASDRTANSKQAIRRKSSCLAALLDLLKSAGKGGLGRGHVLRSGLEPGLELRDQLWRPVPLELLEPGLHHVQHPAERSVPAIDYHTTEEGRTGDLRRMGRCLLARHDSRSSFCGSGVLYLSA